MQTTAGPPSSASTTGGSVLLPDQSRKIMEAALGAVILVVNSGSTFRLVLPLARSV